MSLIAIRFLHVVLGIFWAGAVLFIMLFLDPATREAGPAGGQVMQRLYKRGYMGTLALVGLFTVVSGIYVLWVVSGGFDAVFMGSLRGITLSMGMLMGILALGVAAHLARPAARKMDAVAERVAAAGGSSDPDDVAELARLGSRLTLATRILGVLLALTLVAMVLGAHGA
jgi:uncharacterized membrane protein